MSKIEKMLKQELKSNNEIMVKPFVHGINYLVIMDNCKYYANCLQYVRLNRSFKRLGLAAEEVG